MTCRVEVVGAATTTWVYDYNDENRLWKIRQVSGSCSSPGSDNLRWIFEYDGDGARVNEDYYNGTTTVITLYFVGGMYEVTDPSGANTITRYYSLGGSVMKYDGTDLEYILSDQQGSTMAVLDDAGVLVANSEKRYLPFGDVRTDLGTSNQTDYVYTGQREIEGSELMDYNARFLNPGLSRFTQPDTIIPNPANPQSLNRYSYALNNPVKYTDPTGHRVTCGENGEGGGCGSTGNGDDLDEELVIIVCGCSDDLCEEVGPDCDQQMPVWMDGDTETVKYPGGTRGKRTQAEDIKSKLDEKGILLTEAISLICYSGGADACLMYAQSRIAAGGLIGSLVLLGPSFTGKLPGGVRYLDDFNTETGKYEWEMILDNVLSSGTNVYLLDDKAWESNKATSYQPPDSATGTLTFENDQTRNHYGNPAFIGNSTNNDPIYAASIFSWVLGN